MGREDAKYSNDHQRQTYPEVPIAILERLPHALAFSFDVGIAIETHFTGLPPLRITRLAQLIMDLANSKM